jgi:hypothetical protein
MPNWHLNTYTLHFMTETIITELRYEIKVRSWRPTEVITNEDVYKSCPAHTKTNQHKCLYRNMASRILPAVQQLVAIWNV